MTAMYTPGDGYIWNQGAPGTMDLEKNKLVQVSSSNLPPSLRPADHIIKFVLTLPHYKYLIKPEYLDLFEEYKKMNGVTLGVSFTLYALIQNLTESVEHAITNKRSKGGFVENHWGPRPSSISASGQAGMHLSAFGLTPFHTENESILYWDPTNPITFKQTASGAPGGNPIGGGFLNDLTTMGSTMLNDLFKSGKDQLPITPQLPQISQDDVAKSGINLAFRKFRMILDLFRMNGVIFDTIPNPDIYPSTYVAPENYVDSNGVQQQTKSLVNNSGTTLEAGLAKVRENEMLAPGNVRAVLPIEMYVKDTKYTGFFETFNYQFSEDNPFVVHYDFTFKAKSVERMALFFPNATAGKKPYTLIVNGNKPAWKR